jgi:predicted transcriptional regulator
MGEETVSKQQKLTVKVSSFKEAISEFKDVWKRHAQGEKLDTPIETLRFENTFTLLKTLTPRRLELLQQLHMLGNMSIRALAKNLGREYSNVHQDVKMLHHADLVLQDDKGKYYVPWDKIVTEIPMTTIPEHKNDYQQSSAVKRTAYR